MACRNTYKCYKIGARVLGWTCYNLVNADINLLYHNIKEDGQMRLTKKIASAVLALTLVVAMSAQCFGATWGSYFGYNEAWYEGAEGELSSEDESGWTATMTMIGYGGCWGGQIFQDPEQGTGSISVVKGQTYKLSFDMISSNCDKWVYVKISSVDETTGDELLAFGDWVQLKRGETYQYEKTFTAAANASSIYFGIGGEFGDRQGVDIDAEVRYALTDVALLNDVDPTAATEIKCENFKLAAMCTPVKNVKKNIKNLNKLLKTIGKITVKQGKYKVTIKRSGSAVAIQAKKGKKTVVNIKVKKNNYKKVFKGMDKKAAKAIDKVLLANTGLKLKNLGK